MRKLTGEEFSKEIEEGAGILSFMGGVKSQNGREILLTGDDAFLFEKEEKGSEEWFRIVERQRREEAAYLK